MVALSGAAACLLAVALACGVGSAGAATVVGSKTIVNVGGAGSYDEVTDMPCHGQAACMKRPRAVAGCLAPFDEEQTLKLRGPMEVSSIGVYYPGAGGDWQRVSFYDRSGSMDNMVFLADYGRAADGFSVDEGSCWSGGGDFKFISNGDDFMCNGFNQSYVSRDGKCASRTPQAFDGTLEDGVQVNVMQASKCAGGDCGFYRGQGHHGWAGAAKMFAVRARFPVGFGNNAPALWFLHASVVRTANYHPQMCNCRGMGGAGGCGELDIAEVVEEQNRKEDVDTTVYSFKGAFSDQGAYTFRRPSHQEAVFMTIFNPEGYIQVIQMDTFDFGASIPASRVGEWNGRRELVIKLPGEEMAGCAAPRCSYIYELGNAGFAARIADGVSCSGGSGGVPPAQSDQNTWGYRPPPGQPAPQAQPSGQENGQNNGQENGQNNGQYGGESNGQDNGQGSGQYNGQDFARPAPGNSNEGFPQPWGQPAPMDGGQAGFQPLPAQQPPENTQPGYAYNGNPDPHGWGAGWGENSNDGTYNEYQNGREYYPWGGRRRLSGNGGDR